MKRTLAAVLALWMMLCALSCGMRNDETDAADTSENQQTGMVETLPETDEKTDPVTGSDETDPAPETEAEEAVPERIYNYLNGKTVTEEEQKRRPVAIMINNIKKSLPQEGVTRGDVYYECAAEGGITRIMMVTSDYESLPTVGSIRSSRDYFVDFLFNHDALYVHAGGSNQAYIKIRDLKVDNIDGVNMNLPTTFWRDQNRMWNMGYEHSLMTDGAQIAATFAHRGARMEIAEDHVPTLRFFDEETTYVPEGHEATHLHMQSTSIQTVDFVYDEKAGEYLRYQYSGMAHVDGAGNQISVKNVLVLFTDISRIPGDTEGRLAVQTIGEGEGYYLTCGKALPIRWSREDATASMQFTCEDGTDLLLNCGKTFICVVDDSVEEKMDFTYDWNK